MEAIVHAADIQDPLGDSEAALLRGSRDGGVLLMATLFGMHPFLLKLYADAGYQGPKFQTGLAQACRAVNVEIVRRCDSGQFGVAEALDRGAHDRLAQPVPALEQGLGVPEPERARIPPLGVNPADAATPSSKPNMILDRL